MPKFCENCGGVVRDDAAFCPNCGYEVEAGEHAHKAPQARQEARGTLEDLRKRFGQFEEDEAPREEEFASDVYDQEEEDEPFEDELEEEPNPRERGGLMGLFKGAFGGGGVYGQPGMQDEEDEPDPYEDTQDFSQTYSIDETVDPEESILRWQDDHHDPVDEEEEEDEYLIYDAEDGFIRKIVIVCFAIILLSGAAFGAVRLLGSQEEPAVVEQDEELEALKNTATTFFREVRDIAPQDLREYDRLYFGNYEGDEDALAEDLSLFSYYALFSDMRVARVESAAVTGNLGAVRLEIEGSEEEQALFTDSQFRRLGEAWQYDFAHFAQSLEALDAAPPADVTDPETPSQTEDEPDPATRKEEARQTIRDFDDAWIEYVNTGADGVFEYLKPGSTAYGRIANANVSGLQEELLALDFGAVMLHGDTASVEAYEKFKKVRDGEVTIAEYDWLYVLEETQGRWLVSDYSRLEPDEAPQPDPEPEPEPEPEPSALPDGFILEGSVSGGSDGASDAVRLVRYSAATNRLVFELSLDGTGAQNPGAWRAERTATGVRVTFEGDVAWDAPEADLSGGLVDGLSEAATGQAGLSLTVLLEEDTAFKAFDLDAYGDAPARLVLDFAS